MTNVIPFQKETIPNGSDTKDEYFNLVGSMTDLLVESVAPPALLVKIAHRLAFLINDDNYLATKIDSKIEPLRPLLAKWTVELTNLAEYWWKDLESLSPAPSPESESPSSTKG